MKRRNVLAAVFLACVVAIGLLAVGCGNKTAPPASTAPVIPPDMPSTAPAGQSKVTVFLMKGETVFQVSREAAPGGAQQALSELLKGPTEAEKQQGLSTAIPGGTRLNRYAVENGKAKADFSGELKNYGGGSARVQAIINQIDNTVLSNDPTVKSVEITVDGVGADEALQP